MPYAYVVYDHTARRRVRRIREWLAPHDILLAGRYSEWEYYNSDHAFLAGRKAAEQAPRRWSPRRPPTPRSREASHARSQAACASSTRTCTARDASATDEVLRTLDDAGVERGRTARAVPLGRLLAGRPGVAAPRQRAPRRAARGTSRPAHRARRRQPGARGRRVGCGARTGHARARRAQDGADRAGTRMTNAPIACTRSRRTHRAPILFHAASSSTAARAASAGRPSTRPCATIPACA